MSPNDTLPQLRLPSLFPPAKQIQVAPPTDRVPVIRRPGKYRVDYEQVGDLTFVHVAIDRWTPSIRAEFSRDIDQAALLHGGPFLVLCPKSDKKLKKFCSLFNFEHAMNVLTKEGIDSEILIKRRK